MKTILYNPIFINPQAYYVFPRLTRYLQPDNESTAEPANYIGTIEVKVIAYGDTTLKRTYTNTDSIDLSEFKNTWIRISLFTKVGSCVLGEWKIGNMESDLPYIDPEVLASLKAVVIVGNKTNNDSDRAIVKNLVDPDNPFVISNAAYTEGSGYADKGSPYYGAFVTDGIDDLIKSTKTVQEMLGGSNEITVVSMIHQVKDSSNNVSFTNYIRGSAKGYFRNIVNNYDKTGIYGYTSSDLMGLSVVNNILGDKNDYTSNGDNRDSIINGNFSVQGYSYNDGNNTGDFSSVAWYWTIIANKVLTTDQINQVIAYFNLDRTLKSDIYCNIAKQGITNENHAEFGDKLIDYSGNGRDIQLNNISWNKESGINDDGALCLDGVNDFGQFVGDLGLKDYTFIADRAYDRIVLEQAPFIASKSTNGQAPFLMEYLNSSNYVYPHSFGATTKTTNLNIQRQISYQSTYVYNGNSISKGTSVDTGDGLTIGNSGSTGAQYSPLCLWSLMLFPYSMSEFLIERQLKKHKLGTLYPDMVEFRPIVKSNSEYQVVDYYIDTLPAVVGNYYQINSKLRVAITTKGAVDEVTQVTVGGVPLELKNSNGNRFTFDGTLSDKSPQKINITIDEYIRFEDIVQPYPVLLRFKDENGNEVSWGGKFRVGSTITRIGSIADPESNLLNGLYSISGLSLNGKAVTSSTSIVEKQMVFRTTATWLLDNNEPKVILSPSRLRIPNSSYKLLGYIPDISGHGNNGVIHNSAYAEGSGVNEDGSYQFDGVDDFITIPTTVGGKQVLMKVNWSTLNGFIYDQRPASGDKTFGIYAQGDVIAYSQHNNGNTYIDGIINNNIIGNNLSKITHNIVATCDVDNSITPSIGKRSYSNSYFAQMSLYDFMLFDEISTEAKIKELNTYIGITPKVTLPNYYWDNYGKKNTDANRGYIDEQVSLQKTGTSVNPLENFNISYEGMSGYNGYPVVFGKNKTWLYAPASKDNGHIYTNDSIKYNIEQITFSVALCYSYIKQNGEIITSSNKDVESFKIKVTGLEPTKFILNYRYIDSADAINYSVFEIVSDGIYEIPKSVATNGNIKDFTWIGFNFTKQSADIPNIITDVNITIEILPEYENGLAYDGVSDFTDNKNIPIFTDFTAIIKRVDLDAKNDNSTVMFKGNKIYESGIENGFILDYCYNSKNYVYSYGKLNQIKRDDSKIIYLTPESYNGNSIIKGENEDNPGLVFGKYWKGIIYKTILYSKTISLLEINFLKNLMEKDEIIDLNNKIFIQE